MLSMYCGRPGIGLFGKYTLKFVAAAIVVSLENSAYKKCTLD